jgi:signal peptidase I
MTTPTTTRGSHAAVYTLEETRRKEVRRTLLVPLLGALLFLVFFFYNFQTVTVKGHSMEPTLRDNQRILVCKALWLVGQPKRGDIVVIKGDQKGEYLVKRVVATEGEFVDYQVQPFEHDFTFGKYRVPEGYVYVVGDNLAASEDSRTFGPVPLERLLGKVVEY